MDSNYCLSCFYKSSALTPKGQNHDKEFRQGPLGEKFIEPTDKELSEANFSG